MKTKRCSCCGRRRGVGMFARRTASRDGMQSWCRSCNAAAGKCHRRGKQRQRMDYQRAYRQQVAAGNLLGEATP